MWIEIYDKEESDWHLINSESVSVISKDCDEDIQIISGHDGANSRIYLKGSHFYNALILALQGHETDLGELGHVKPLKNSQREEIAKRLNYLDAISDIQPQK